MEIRFLAAPTSVPDVAIEELTNLGCNVNLNGDADYKENHIGIVTVEYQIDTDAGTAKTSMDCSVIKDTFHSLKYFLYDNEFGVYCPVTDVRKKTGGNWEIHFTGEVSSEDLVMQYSPVRTNKATIDYTDDSVYLMGKKQVPSSGGLKTKRKFRF